MNYKLYKHYKLYKVNKIGLKTPNIMKTHKKKTFFSFLNSFFISNININVQCLFKKKNLDMKNML